MKQTKILAILLALALLLTGCAQLVDLTQRLAENRDEQLKQLARQGKTREPFSQMTYTRPDMEAFQALAEESCRLGQTSEDVDQILEQTTQLYEAYDRFYTMLSLADIYYCKDLSNAEAQAEYEFCTGQSGQVEQALEAYYQALAQGPAVEELEEYFQARREIAVDVQVRAPETQEVNVSVQVRAAGDRDGEQVLDAVEGAIQGWFTGKLLGRDILRVQLGDLIYSCDGVENYAIIAPAADVAVEADTLPQLGTLTVEEMA